MQTKLKAVELEKNEEKLLKDFVNLYNLLLLDDINKLTFYEFNLIEALSFFSYYVEMKPRWKKMEFFDNI